MAKNLTEVRLLAVPLENDYLQTFYFDNINAQETYFKSKTIHTMTDCSYQRKDHVIRFNMQYDEIIGCNYVMYLNPAYTSHWVYAFITRMEYIDDGRTDIYIETDVMQTWMFDYDVKPSFVEREHCNNDKVGLNTVPEQLETGEYVGNYAHYNDNFIEAGIILATTWNLSSFAYEEEENILDIFSKPKKRCTRPAGGELYNGVYSGCFYYYFDAKRISNNESYFEPDLDSLNGVLRYLELAGQSDGIIALFMAPKNALELIDGGTIQYSAGDLPIKLKLVKPSSGVFSTLWGSDDAPITKASVLDYASDNKGYTPRNKKLLTYPYVYMMVDNNSGGSAIYRYEDFWGDDCSFAVNYALSPGGSVRLIPQFYKGIALNNNEGLNGGKYPVCSWSTDVYTNWLTQNSVNIGISVASSALTVAGGVAMMATGGGAIAGAGAVSSGLLGVASTVGEIYQHSLQAPQCDGNINSGDVTFANGDLTFTLYKMSIKKEYAKIIDSYFDMFGYKTNLVKTPLSNHRKNWWYTKTIDVNIDGAVPQDDLIKIKDCYNRGITFWKNPENIGNYSLDNSIV